MDLYYVGDPLEGSRWEGLSFEDYLNMTNEERQELKEFLVNLIDVPPGSNFVDEDGIYDEWIKVVSFASDEEIRKYILERKIIDKIISLFEIQIPLTKEILLNEKDLGEIPRDAWLKYVSDDSKYDDGVLFPF